MSKAEAYVRRLVARDGKVNTSPGSREYRAAKRLAAELRLVEDTSGPMPVWRQRES